MTPEQLLLRSALKSSPTIEGRRQSNLPQRDDFLRWAAGAASSKDEMQEQRSAVADKLARAGSMPVR